MLMPQAVKSRLSVVIPLYNSESTVGPLVDELVACLRPQYEGLEIVLVNDGSKDDTHQAALGAYSLYPEIVKYLQLTRNFGEHNAVMCGLRHCSGDCAAIIDDDFQNPPEEIAVLASKLCEGHDVVYGYYQRKQHHWIRNLGSRFTNLVAGKLLPKPSGLYLSSFKVLDRSLVRSIVQYSGPYPYLDGLILRSTDSISSVQVRHAPRLHGRSNYTLRRLIRLWLNMFTGFSILPLRIASLLGVLMSAAGFLLAIFFAFSWKMGGILFSQPIPPGWASLIVTVIIFSGIQLCVLGVLGEYLGRLFLTQNRTPQFLIRQRFGTADPPHEDNAAV